MQLTKEQRYQISGLLKTGFRQSQIAAEAEMHKSTISRKLKRNKKRNKNKETPPFSGGRMCFTISAAEGEKGEIRVTFTFPIIAEFSR